MAMKQLVAQVFN